jgi:hypothetical protein
MMFERHGLKVDGYSAIAPEDIAMFFQRFSKTMKLIKSYRSKEKSYKKQLQKQRKTSGNGEYNLVKFVRCHRHTRYEATMCPAQILASQPSNILKIQYFEITNCVRKTHWEGASNKKSIR